MANNLAVTESRKASDIGDRPFLAVSRVCRNTPYALTEMDDIR